MQTISVPTEKGKTMREKLIELLITAKDLVTLSRQADFLIANGVTIQKWIPVTERLPEEDGRYLCKVKSFLFPGTFYITMLHYVDGGFVEGHIYTDDVTHWMPLPEPPTEVE